ncbi:type II toxin-antitoxin system PemK/MazF family toxin [Lactobacillus johnsonii]|uniref:type II toxin-antitoxin system PemK/MazF family toxin n=1 Tax=Lactobacillus johnsonii TaxID=33959 RepID=UPI001F58FB3D|nr:type II toxin-antitoxin system PemK/MazF family toxin [Lactobacillus johnsonii]UNL59697.1 type II toxin-antitoxin system PemK/MazF family toxin [Lactobacillus johnsonii]
MDKNEHIENASKKFKQVCDPNKYHYQQKFKSLPYWLEESSHYFSLEANKKIVDRYYYYSRGSIISVNFGVNEGSEFSNLHFAVVLNKKDSPQNRTLTVIPLTSKKKPGLFSLGTEIFNQTSVLILEHLNKVKKKIEVLEKHNKEITLMRQKLLDDNKKFNQDLTVLKAKVEKVLNDTEDSSSNQVSSLSELYNAVIQKSLEANSLEQDAKKLDEKGQQLVKEIAECQVQEKQLAKVVSVYKKYNKNTFARIEDITTISKLRIRKINRFDPSGDIKLSSDQMTAISDRLMQLYVSKD